MLNVYRKKFYQVLTIMSVFIFGAYMPSNAGIVSTTDIVEVKQVQLDREYILESLAREEVQSMLELEGVNAADAKARVESMTNMEIQTLAAQMDKLPVGAGLSTLEWLLVIIIIILLL